MGAGSGTTAAGVLDVDWSQAASVAVLAAIVSVLMSVIASGVGDKGTPAFLRTAPPEQGE